MQAPPTDLLYVRSQQIKTVVINAGTSDRPTYDASHPDESTNKIKIKGVRLSHSPKRTVTIPSFFFASDDVFYFFSDFGRFGSNCFFLYFLLFIVFF